MKNISKTVCSIALGALVAGCADYNDTDSFKVTKPESISKYEYLNEYDVLNAYVDRTAHPDFKLGAAVNGVDYADMVGDYTLAASNFDMVTPTTEFTYGSCVDDNGSITTDIVRKVANAARINETEVFGSAIVSDTQQNANYLNKVIDNAVAALGKDQMVTDYELNFAETTTFPFEILGKLTPTISDGALHATFARKDKMWLVQNIDLEAGTSYQIEIRMKADRSLSLQIRLGNLDNVIKLNVLDAYSTFELQYTAGTDPFVIQVDPGNVQLSLDVEYVAIKHQRALNDQEKQQLFVVELEKWVNALMESHEGYIKNWTLIDKAIADAPAEGEQYCALRTGRNSGTTFYWQDALGATNYAKVAESITREKFAEYGGNAADLKLFVNESCCGNPDKTKSLLHWVGTWEGAGAKIDGIGLEVRIAASRDAAAVAKAKADVAEMLAAVAGSGKLVYISALEIGMKDEAGANIATADMTAADEQAVADLYTEVVKTYFEKVPAAQQFGICQWTLVEGTNPGGLWSAANARVPAYAGFVKGLQSK